MNIYVAKEFDYDHHLILGVFTSYDKARDAIDSYIRNAEYESCLMYMSYGISTYVLDTDTDEDNGFTLVYEDLDGKTYEKMRGNNDE
jgi:hypothetical protein